MNNLIDTLTGGVKRAGVRRLAVLTMAALVVAAFSAAMAGAYGPQADGSSYGTKPPVRNGYNSPGKHTLDASVPVVPLGSALSKGLRANVNCPAACSLVGQIKIDAKTAKQLKLGRAVGKGKASSKRAASTPLVVRFNKTAKKALKNVKTLKLQLVITAGTARTIKKITLKR
jgi:hypothetical protein